MSLFLTDKQLAELQRHPQYKTFGQSCPVCRGTGRYRYQGEEWECGDDDYGHTMLERAKRYWLANIGLQYQRLGWEDYPHCEVRAEVEEYLASYDFMRLSGIGITFTSPTLGVGKTWAATHVLKELVKRSVPGWFTPSADIIGSINLEEEERSFLIGKVLGVEVLVIDDIKSPYTQRQQDYQADKLEEVVRRRTDNNLPTIITTNMTQTELCETFPRIHSLLGAKNMPIELSGIDARSEGLTYKVNVDLALAGESAPIL